MDSNDGFDAATKMETPLKEYFDASTWARIHASLQGSLTKRGAGNEGTRQFLDLVLLKAESGIPWSDLPLSHSKIHNVYVRFCRWTDDGVWPPVLEAMSEAPEAQRLLEQLVRNHMIFRRSRKFRSEILKAS
ncbi:transposase [Pseudoxanthomonas sacheonensis]|uniref:Transposase n=1 Tax=Pseudoxanthomonas sacheonensis TaxID=443615 RepID=A0ABU1RXG3_9GAMM|nr:transposase [Pseudoxanthomonas sacheonensis]MDR6842824.1 transposase [Pseudoxanthomonas sacheonensis]